MKDKTGKTAERLKSKKLYLLDMDGTIYNENEILMEHLNFLEEIRQRGAQYIFITNNSSKSVKDYVKKSMTWGFLRTKKILYIESGDSSLY